MSVNDQVTRKPQILTWCQRQPGAHSKLLLEAAHAVQARVCPAATSPGLGQATSKAPGRGVNPSPASPWVLPSLIVIQVSKQHVLGDGLGQRRHGLVVLGDDLQGKPEEVRLPDTPQGQSSGPAPPSTCGIPRNCDVLDTELSDLRHVTNTKTTDNRGVTCMSPSL